MTRAEEIQARILTTLRHGPLLLEQLADEIDVAPFTVDAYLKDMRRQNLVEATGWKAAQAVSWRLTAAGENAALVAQQLRLA